MKRIIYFDMDNVLVDFKSGIDRLDGKTKKTYEGRLDEVPSIFKLMNPMEGAIDAVHKLSKTYDVYILSTSPWLNPTALQDKLDWIKKYFGDDENNIFYKRVIFSHNKHLLKGDYLIDDRTKNGADRFEGKLIQFGSAEFPNWISVLDALF
jgi:5'(3')-deoxyribonucleotidase